MAGSLDVLNRSQVAPVVTAAGFTRSGRTYRLGADNGDQVFLALGAAGTAPGAVRFRVHWTVLTISQWQWYTRRDPDPGPPNPNDTWFLTNDLTPPGRDRGALWSFPDGDEAERDKYGAVLAGVLTDDLLPWLISMLDRAALLAELAAPSRAWMPGMSGAPRREIIALLGYGPRDEIERRLPLVEEYSPEDNFREWVRASLDAD